MDKNGLKREVGLMGALSTVVGTVIGAGVFFKIASMAERTGSANLIILAWILAGTFTVAGGLTVAELATMFPETGGAVKYLEKAYGGLVGYLFAWIQTLIYYPASIAALAIIWATQFTNLFGMKQGNNIIFISLIILVSIIALNSLGTRVASFSQSLFTVLKLIPIALIIIFGLLSKAEVHFSLFPFTAGKDINFVTGLGGAIVASMFAFDGWIGVGNIAGEMKHPERDLPKAIIGGLSLIMFIYIAISFVMLKFMPVEAIAGNKNTASEVAQMIFGNFGGKLVTIGILISVYGAMNGYTFSAVRVPYTIALEENLPKYKFFQKLNRFSSPFNASLIIGVMSSLMILTKQFDMLTDLVIFVTWGFSLLLFISVFKFRKTMPNANRPYKVIGYPLVPIIAIVGALYIMYSSLTTNFTLSMIGIGATLLGIPAYYLTVKNKK
ncbi:amino acid permease [Floricoccus penangensis]|uniref:Amino acid permease n=1 Tax=Floricoccus penangensis TaxID=1859475 RepID=A0A9Q5NZX7_9LACT|nr:amino acid permease [Floricoccus penangensis]OFI46292.1 amino acid permease [Floricoccus penangensis]